MSSKGNHLKVKSSVEKIPDSIDHQRWYHRESLQQSLFEKLMRFSVYTPGSLPLPGLLLHDIFLFPTYFHR